ncbi:Nociceptin receptor [Holothuria leucospilota]|uniref:Nociceptin receptor n=1 Tax=Holothuria leucospilota TaxID=206669 RepID=A0A9Q1BRP6_HOLLE|nr:Nociceptin receptor [Holothuria leucospilota]
MDPQGSSDIPQKTGVTIVSLMLILVGIVGITGNSLVLIVLLRIIKRHKRNQTYWLIGNQSVADMFSSIQMILIQLEGLIASWQPPPPNTLAGVFYCFLWTTQIFMFGSFVVSSFNLAILSLERYFAVVHPQFYITRLRQTFCMVGLSAWLYAPIMQVVAVGLHFEYHEGECVYKRGSPFLGVLLFLWEYFLPVTVMTFCFFQISLKFRQLNHIQNTWQKENTDRNDLRQDRRSAVHPVPPSSGLRTSSSSFERAESHVENGPRKFVGQQSSSSSETPRPTIDSDKVDAVATIVNTNQTHITSVSGNRGSQTPSSIQRRNSTLTLFIVYIAYILCWTLNQWSFLVYNVGGPLDFNGVYYRVALIMATSNSCINVFIYAFRFKMFQQGIKALFKVS